jgi:hypothetical protein
MKTYKITKGNIAQWVPAEIFEEAQLFCETYDDGTWTAVNEFEYIYE